MGLSGASDAIDSEVGVQRGCLTSVRLRHFTRFHFTCRRRDRLRSETADNETVTAQYFPDPQVQYRATRTVFNSKRRI